MSSFSTYSFADSQSDVETSRHHGGGSGKHGTSSNVTAIAGTVPQFRAKYIKRIVMQVGNEELTILPLASGGDGELTYSLLQSNGSELPDGLSFLESSVSLRGNPETTAIGNYTLLYSAVDTDGDSVNQTISLTIMENLVPVLPEVADISVALNKRISRVKLPKATGGNQHIRYSVSGLPSGLYLFGRNIFGRAKESGIFDVVYRAEDVDGDIATVNFVITVTSSAQTDTTDIDDISVNTQRDLPSTVLPVLSSQAGTYTYGLTQSDGVELPSWLNFDAQTRVINGTAGEAGNYSLIYTETENATSSLNRTFQLEVIDTLPDLGSSFDIQINVNEALGHKTRLSRTKTGETPITYSLELTNGSALPDWLLFDADSRRLQGRHSEAANLSLTYIATDFDGDSTNHTFNLIVIDTQPELAEIDDLSTSVDQSLHHKTRLPKSSSGDHPISYRLTLINGSDLPSWLSFSPFYGRLSGTPSEAGSIELVYTATDSNGDSANQTFAISVSNSTQSNGTLPNLPLIKDIQTSVEKPLWSRTRLPRSSGTDIPITYSLTLDDGSAIPDWLEFDTLSRRLSGTPPEVANLSLLYMATDDNGDVANRTFNLLVVDTQPSLSVINDFEFNANKYFSERLPRSKTGDGPLKYTLALSNGSALPSGISFSQYSRKFFGKQSASASLSLIYTVTDFDGDSSNQTFVLNIIGGEDSEDTDTNSTDTDTNSTDVVTDTNSTDTDTNSTDVVTDTNSTDTDTNSTDVVTELVDIGPVPTDLLILPAISQFEVVANDPIELVALPKVSSDYAATSSFYLNAYSFARDEDADNTNSSVNDREAVITTTEDAGSTVDDGKGDYVRSADGKDDDVSYPTNTARDTNTNNDSEPEPEN